MTTTTAHDDEAAESCDAHKTRQTTSENGVRWLLCPDHAAEVEALGYLIVRRLPRRVTA